MLIYIEKIFLEEGTRIETLGVRRKLLKRLEERHPYRISMREMLERDFGLGKSSKIDGGHSLL